MTRSGARDNEISNNVSSIKWHSDMSYEMYVSHSTTYQRTIQANGVIYVATGWEQPSSTLWKYQPPVVTPCTCPPQLRTRTSQRISADVWLDCRPHILDSPRRLCMTIAIGIFVIQSRQSIPSSARIRYCLIQIQSPKPMLTSQFR